MQFSRSHTGMLAVVSIFTGMIAPVVAGANRTYPFPLTDMQWGAYIILALLVVSFYLVSVGRWRVFQIVSLLLFFMIGYLFFMSVSGGVHDSLGNTIPSLSWGWGFLVIGTGFLLYTMLGHDEKTEKLALFIDHILGIVGSFTLFCLTALIIFVSYVPNHARNNESILETFFSTGGVTDLSGVLLSPAYDNIQDLVFDRRTGDIRFVASSSGVSYVFPGGNGASGKPYYITNIGRHLGIIQADGKITIDGQIQSGSAVLPQSMDNALMSKTASGLVFINQHGETLFPGNHLQVSHIVQSEDMPVVAWAERSGTGFVIMKNNEAIGNKVRKVESIAISRSGYDTIALVTSMSGDLEVMKNGVRIEQVLPSYVAGTFQSNGSHTIYVSDDGKIKTVVYDGGMLKNQFEEVREVFLEKSGNSYAFFARPLGEKHYCLFTRYRGNLCGLDGYMNPRLGADGGSILYAGLKDGLWSIYRNADTVIKDTKYHSTNVTSDYAFFDTTNPKQYLFIEKTNDGKYLYRKNGKIMPGTWNDVSLDVWFGYDNKVITAARDASGWRVIEM